MYNKNVYIKGKSWYIRPYHKDTGENLPEGSDMKVKLDEMGGQYTARIKLPFDNRDDAEEYLNGLGIPTDGMFGQLLKKEEDADGNKIITYKVTRPHLIPQFEDPEMGHPKVIDAEGVEWDPETAIGNDSDITVKVNVWKGDKARKLRWEAVRVDKLVPYEPQDDQEGF